MRWFLIIVVGPIVGIYLLGEIVPPVIRMFRGSPATAPSGTFGASSEERNALLQQLAEIEAQEQQQSSTRASPSKSANEIHPIRVPLINDDRFGMNADEFRSNHGGEPIASSPRQLKSWKADYGVGETFLLRPNPGFTTPMRYIFLNGKFGAIEADVHSNQYEAFVADLTAQLNFAPVEVAGQPAAAADKPGKRSDKPHLCWENNLVRVTLKPMGKYRYSYEALHKVYAKPLIDFYADMGNAPK